MGHGGNRISCPREVPILNITKFSLSPNSFTGFRETAFAYATFSAGVLYQVTRACSMGQLRTCGCDTRVKGEDVDFQWGGCSHDIQFGTSFVEEFLDSREKGRDMQSKMNLHNNRAGRIVSIMSLCGII